MNATDRNGEPITHKRIRHRLTTLIEVLPMAVAGNESTRVLLANVRDDLQEARA